MSFRTVLDRGTTKLGLREEWNQFLHWYAMRAALLREIPRCGSRIAQVVGTPRSGSTLLSTMIDAHSEAVCLIEPYLGWLKYGEFSYDWDRLDTPLSEYSRRRPDRLLRHICRDTEYSIVAFKETFRTEWHPTFPTQEFLQENFDGGVDHTIAILRDPRDTWASVIQRHPQLEGDTTVLCELIHAWNELCSWISKRELQYVMYEKLVSEPQGSVKKVLDTLGLNNQTAVVNPPGIDGHGDKRAQQGGAIDDSSVGQFKDVLAPEACRFIEAQCKINMEIMGYNW